MCSSANPQEQETTQRSPELRSNTKHLNPKPTQPPFANVNLCAEGSTLECTPSASAHVHPGGRERDSRSRCNVHRAGDREFTVSHAVGRVRGSHAQRLWRWGQSLSPRAQGSRFAKGAKPRRGGTISAKRQIRTTQPNTPKAPGRKPKCTTSQGNTRSTNHSPELQVPEFAVKGSRRKPLHLSAKFKHGGRAGGQNLSERARREAGGAWEVTEHYG